jgi:hypothetical protein
MGMRTWDIGEGSSVTEGTGLKVSASQGTVTNSSDCHMLTQSFSPLKPSTRRCDILNTFIIATVAFLVFVFANGGNKESRIPYRSPVQ